MGYQQIKTSLAALALSLASTSALATSPPPIPESVVTAYQGGTGLVQEQKTLSHRNGHSEILLPGLGSGLIGDSLNVTPQNPDAIQLKGTVLPDPMAPHAILSRFVGEEITWLDRNPATGQDSRRKGVLLSLDGGPVLQFGDQVEMNPPGRAILTSAQMSRIGSRAPKILVHSDGSGESVFDLRYLTGGLGWQAVYAATLSEDESRIDLLGEINLTNRSGRNFSNAQLQVIAGDVRQNAPQPLRLERNTAMKAMAPMMEADMGGIPQQISTHDYWSFRIPGLLDLADDSSIKIPFLSSASVPVKKRYVLQSQDYAHHYRGPEQMDLRPELRLALKNDEKSGLGRAIPAGNFRIFSATGGEFLGENTLTALAKDQRGEVSYGRAFDVTASRKQTFFKQLPSSLSSRRQNNYETGYRITLKNARPAAVVVDIVEILNGDWEILEETGRHVKKDAHRAVWSVAVPANGKAVLDYKVQIRN